MENILAAHKQAQGDDCKYMRKPEHWHQMLETTWLPCFGVWVFFNYYLVSVLQEGRLGGKLLRSKNWNKVSRKIGNGTIEKNRSSHLIQGNKEIIYLQQASFCGTAKLQVALLSAMFTHHFIYIYRSAPVNSDKGVTEGEEAYPGASCGIIKRVRTLFRY